MRLRVIARASRRERATVSPRCRCLATIAPTSISTEQPECRVLGSRPAASRVWGPGTIRQISTTSDRSAECVLTRPGSRPAYRGLPVAGLLYGLQRSKSAFERPVWAVSRSPEASARRYPMRKVTTPVAVAGGVAGGALPMSAGTSFQGRRKPNGWACHRRIMAGVQDAVKHAMSAMSPLKSCGRREAPAPAVDAQQSAGVGRRRGTRGPREAVHVQLEASWSGRWQGQPLAPRGRYRDRVPPAPAVPLVDADPGCGDHQQDQRDRLLVPLNVAQEQLDRMAEQIAEHTE